MKKGARMSKGVKISLIVLGIAVLITIILLITLSLKDNSTGGNNNDNDASLPPGTNQDVKKGAVLYEPKYTFYTFTDPNEEAFTIQLPEGWEASEDSGLIRPYIDAGVKLLVTSPQDQQFLYLSPYGVYTVPNDMLTFSGFPEGSYYYSMLVKSYTEADDFLNEVVNKLNFETEIIEAIERPDLIVEDVIPIITRQSAAEITYTSGQGANQIKNKLIAYTYLVEISGTGVWAASVFGYSSPESLFNETEYLVLKSAETFKVNPEWAAREVIEMNKRAQIIASTQDSISDTISSTFEYKSESQDRINNAWSKAILGVEEVYNSETGDTCYVDSGANYYWEDNQGRVWGTETDENPSRYGEMTKLEIKKDF
jgi:hypothetical protein